MSELLPCSNCGGEAKLSRQLGDERDGYRERDTIACSICGLSIVAYGDISKGGYADNSKVRGIAIAAWNRRAPLPAIPHNGTINATEKANG